MGPVRAAWGRGKVAWGGMGLSRVEYHGTDAEASLTSGRRPAGSADSFWRFWVPGNVRHCLDVWR